MISRLWVKELRNLKECHLTFSPFKHCYIYGKNNQGKSSLLESLYLAIKAESPIQDDRSKVVQYDKEKAIVGVDIDSEEPLRVYCQLEESGKRALYINNQKSRSFKALNKHIFIDYISADILHFFQKEAGFRRKQLDHYCAECFDGYDANLKQYEAVLKQKNRYLKQESVDAAVIDIYNKQMLEKGLPIVTQRLDACRQLELKLHHCLKQLDIVSADTVQMSYIKKRLESSTEADYAQKWQEQLNLDKEKERILGYSLTGPQRDDIDVLLDEKSVSDFSSRGINRIVALLFKLACIESIREKNNVKCCLLLDDTLAEIDSDNKKKLFDYLLGYQQVVYATTEEKDFAYFSDACRYRIHEGEVTHV